MPFINNVEDLEEALALGKYTSVGSYPVCYITYDGGALSYDSVVENKEQIVEAIKNRLKAREEGYHNHRYGVTSDIAQWLVIGYDVNWENEDLYCDHTMQPIECAYPKDKPKGKDEFKADLDKVLELRTELVSFSNHPARDTKTISAIIESKEDVFLAAVQEFIDKWSPESSE